ncbi:MAG: hypothetical protein ACJ0DH_09920 [bacterium]
MEPEENEVPADEHGVHLNVDQAAPDSSSTGGLIYQNPGAMRTGFVAVWVDHQFVDQLRLGPACYNRCSFCRQ